MQELQANYGGALESPKDPRNYTVALDKVDATIPPNEYYLDYAEHLVLNQRKIGKCVASSIVQKAQQYYGIEFSDDFNYLMQKREEGNWTEGCWIVTAPKVAKKYGFLPRAHFPSITDGDPGIGYAEYIEKLKAIPEEKIQQWIELAKDYRIAGYAEVENLDLVNIAKILPTTRTGLLARYVVTKDWFSDIDGIITWAKEKISPLRRNNPGISGHAIAITGYNLEKNAERVTNTWSIAWADRGSALTSKNVKPTEAWVIYWQELPKEVKQNNFKYTFTKDIKRGDKSNEVVYLQTALKILGYYGGEITGYYGVQTTAAVKRYQVQKGMKGTTGRITGVNTRKFINQDIVNYNNI